MYHHPLPEWNAQLIVDPETIISRLHGSATFYCQPTGASDRVNWTITPEIPQGNLEESKLLGRVARLKIRNTTSDLNGTVVECQIVNEQNEVIQTSEMSLLLVQGKQYLSCLSNYVSYKPIN